MFNLYFKYLNGPELRTVQNVSIAELQALKMLILSHLLYIPLCLYLFLVSTSNSKLLFYVYLVGMRVKD